MTDRILWRNLLNAGRPRDKIKTDEERIKKSKHVDHRNEFERDYDRIVASSSLRRLQDKAQVFPLQESDFIRTRLTHSIEVSAIARSFGTWLEKWLITEKILIPDDYGKISSILASAGLIHDIGNPPFGHYGEDVIKSWFNDWVEGWKKRYNGTEEDFLRNYKLTKEELNDFLCFDGNAQGLRVLTRLQFLNDRFGLNLTYGTLSVLIKYPWSSSNKKAQKDKKFGYFLHDSSTANDITKATVKKKETRNPLTYLLEAADDIAYLAADVEDGVKKGLIPWNEVFISICNGELMGIYSTDIEKLKTKHDYVKDNNFPNHSLTSVQNFKVWAQGQMIREVKEAFVKHYDEIMTGTFEGKDLLSKTENAYRIKNLLKGLLQEHCFPCREVLSLELVGDSVINDLLYVFIHGCILKTDEEFETDTRCRAGKIFSIISDNFAFVHLLDEESEKVVKKGTIKELSTYRKLLLITDFISGMTDSYALDLHQKLKGVKMP